MPYVFFIDTKFSTWKVFFFSAIFVLLVNCFGQRKGNGKVSVAKIRHAAEIFKYYLFFAP